MWKSRLSLNYIKIFFWYKERGNWKWKIKKKLNLKEKFRGLGVWVLVECLPGMHRTLGSNPNMPSTIMAAYVYSPVIQEIKAEKWQVSDHHYYRVLDSRPGQKQMKRKEEIFLIKSR